MISTSCGYLVARLSNSGLASAYCRRLKTRTACSRFRNAPVCTERRTGSGAGGGGITTRVKLVGNLDFPVAVLRITLAEAAFSGCIAFAIVLAGVTGFALTSADLGFDLAWGLLDFAGLTLAATTFFATGLAVDLELAAFFSGLVVLDLLGLATGFAVRLVLADEEAFAGFAARALSLVAVAATFTFAWVFGRLESDSLILASFSEMNLKLPGTPPVSR